LTKLTFFDSFPYALGVAKHGNLVAIVSNRRFSSHCPNPQGSERRMFVYNALSDWIV